MSNQSSISIQHTGRVHQWGGPECGSAQCDEILYDVDATAGKRKRCEIELDVQKDGIRWNLLTWAKEKCLQSGAEVSWFLQLSHLIAMYYFTGAALHTWQADIDLVAACFPTKSYTLGLEVWITTASPQSSNSLPFSFPFLNIFLDSALIIAIFDAAIIGFRRHLANFPVSSTNAVPRQSIGIRRQRRGIYLKYCTGVKYWHVE